MQPDFSPPIPLTAVLDSATNLFTVTFDRQLESNPVLFIGNWTLCDGAFTRLIITVNAAGTNVNGRVSAIPGGGCAPASVTYSPGPPDVKALIGTPADPFSLPLTIV